MKRTFYLIPGIVCFTLLMSCSQKPVTLESLLDEMTDRTGMTYFPEQEYSIKQYSSYDRLSESPDGEGWYANRDYTHFIREEEKEGRREFVLLDTEGPG